MKIGMLITAPFVLTNERNGLVKIINKLVDLLT